MFRRIAGIIDIADVVGFAGLVVLAFGAWLLDPRFVPFVVGGFLLLLAFALAKGNVTAVEEQPAERVPGETISQFNRRRASGE